ncbi:MAG TPA: macro domain-containing protein [Chloroflexia bacterium]|jgi:O-acetyl-ADP-ribose deacetylase (regulator of RNase III)
MNINYMTGDATAPQGTGAKIIVHMCNNKGGWGRGFVLALSRRWPEPERAYRAWHRGAVAIPFELGQVQFVQVEADVWVANLIGQHGVRPQGATPPIRYEAIRKGLKEVANQAKALGASVHMPRIGSGLAGGKWEEVAPIAQEELISNGISVTVYDLPS